MDAAGLHSLNQFVGVILSEAVVHAKPPILPAGLGF